MNSNTQQPINSPLQRRRPGQTVRALRRLETLISAVPQVQPLYNYLLKSITIQDGVRQSDRW